MKTKGPTTSVHEPAQSGGTRSGSDASERTDESDETLRVLDESRVLGLLEETRHEPIDPGDTAIIPRVKRMPEGIEVVEHHAGVAEGQWLLQIRCQCGRRWFEVEAVPAVTCPRCGLLVYVNVVNPRPPA